jgi:adenylate cyclase
VGRRDRIGDTVADFTALGDAVNVTARLASTAGPGELLVSDEAFAASGLHLGPLERRRLELRGRGAPVGVHVVRVAEPDPWARAFCPGRSDAVASGRGRRIRRGGSAVVSQNQ